MNKRISGTLKILAMLAAGVYLAALAFLYFRQEALLFFPQPESDTARLFAQYEKSFDINGERLDGWYIPGTLAQTIVYYGGNADELSRQLDKITRIGPFNYLLVNYRGYGESSGSPGEQALKADAQALMETASARFGFDIGETVLIGRSLGSGIATALAAANQVKAVVLVTPYDSVASVARGRYPIFPVNTLLRHPFDSLVHVPRITAPTLIIKAQTDSVIPHRHTDNLIEAWRGPLTVQTLPGTHGNVIDSVEYTRAIHDFLEALPGGIFGSLRPVF